MRGQARVLINKVESDYIRSQIDSGVNIRIKNALQNLCKSYRVGVTIHPNQINGVVNSVTATAFRPTIDEKVRRWVLNALARIGTERMCIPAVLHLMKSYPDDPETIAAGIAAVYKLCTKSDPEAILAGIGFDPQMRTLAALQHVPASSLALKDLPLDVDRATPDLLKLALLLVGLNRSPENLLSPRHSDSEMVRALGRHHDAIVSQYSVWAITENEKLHLIHLGLDLRDIESHPDNVRSWLYQLLAIEATNAEPHWEYIALGMDDPSIEARSGLAVGLKDTYIDVFEPLVLDWMLRETDPDIRRHIMEHIVRQATRSPTYERYAIDIFDGEPAGSVLRQSMEVNSVQTPLYIKFKQIGAGIPDLFERNLTMIDRQYNIQNVNAGAVGFDGSTASNQAPLTIQMFSQQQVKAVQMQLANLEAALHANTALEAKLKNNALSYISEAKADASSSKVVKVVEFIDHMGTLAGATTALAPYVDALRAAIGL